MQDVAAASAWYKKHEKMHDRVIFHLSRNKKRIYNDVRKFGFIKFIKKINLEQHLHRKNLGPEPLEKKFNLSYFKQYIVNKNRTIKDILMDQKFISGLGNIYVNETLFLSGIKPIKKVKNLSESEIRKIIKFTKKILSKAIALGGSSIKNFSSDNGKKGLFQQYFCVYGKKDEKCSKKSCGSNIIKIVISNQETFYCDKCQR